MRRRRGINNSKINVIGVSACNANSVDLDQTPRYAASDQGLDCLQKILLWDGSP